MALRIRPSPYSSKPNDCTQTRKKIASNRCFRANNNSRFHDSIRQDRDDVFLRLVESSVPTLSHVILHAVGVGFSSVLLAISLVAFLRDHRTRFLFLTGAFAGLAIKQTIGLGDAFLTLGEFILPGTTLELGHFLDLIVILLLSFGILRSAIPASALAHRAGSVDTS